MSESNKIFLCSNCIKPLYGQDIDAVIAERDTLAARVESLWKQRKHLISFLQSIRDNGGVSDRQWLFIDNILAISSPESIYTDVSKVSVDLEK